MARLTQAPAAPAGPGAEHPTCSLGTSIAQFLHLLLHTRPGQLRSAPNFGCAIWEAEFDSKLDVPRWEETLTRSLLAAVHQHEPRLREVRIRVSIGAAEQPRGPAAPSAARWQAHISIRGVVQLTHEAFSYATQLLIGKLAA